MALAFKLDDLERIDCPLCGQSSFEVLATTDRYKMGLHTVGCVGCGLVLTNPRPSKQAMAQFYAHDYRRYYTGFQSPSEAYIQKFRRRERADHHADYLDRAGLLRPALRVLDIGCAEGSLLKAIEDRCPTGQFYGVEPNPDFVEFARNYLDLKKTYSSVEDWLADSEAPPFDLVTIVHVLEHVENPVAFLAQLRGKLAQGGRIYIDVPDISAYGDIDMLHIAHLFHFSCATLTLTAEEAGYEVALIEQHAPPAHPLSVRMILADSASHPSASSPPAEGRTVGPPDEWDAVRRAMSRSRSYFFRRSTLGRILLRGPRRLMRMLAGR